MRNIGLHNLLFSFVFLVSCGQPQNEASSVDVIFNGSLTDFNDIPGSDSERLVKSIGMMGAEAGLCTATHIGDGFVLTAGHCVRTDRCEPDYQVTWGRTARRPSGILKSRCTEIVERRWDDEVDYAIYKVFPAPDFSLDVKRDQRPSMGANIFILSHPRGTTLKFSGLCTIDDYGFGLRFTYQCDTEGGSSGASVLNAQGQIVGIHNSGSRGLGYNAGTWVYDVLR